MSLLQHTKSLCKQYNIRPLRRRGQNFLISPYTIDKIIAGAELNKDDIVLEIGAGLGTLTKHIVKHVGDPRLPIGSRGSRGGVIAVEIDKKLVKVLNQELRDYKNIEIIQEDIRKIKNEKLKMKNYKIIANLPFNITGLVLRKFLQQKNKPQSMVVITQKQVGQRITAKPPKMNLLAVSVQFYAQVKILKAVGKKNFWPRPRVDSVILKITTTKVRNADEGKFFKVVKAGFLHPRKYLLNNLTKSAILKNITANKLKNELLKIFNNIGLNPKVRAQELSVEEWIELVNRVIR